MSAHVFLPRADQGNIGLVGSASSDRTAAHEAGHMLGAKDEYGEVDGKDWGGGSSTIMGGGTEPQPDHYAKVLQGFRGAAGGDVKGTPSVVPVK